MNLATLALFERSLRVETRAIGTYVGRLVLVITILFVLMIAHAESRMVGAAGLMFFVIVSFVNLVFISLAGIGYFASAITEEKEEMTLGLLRMTNLNPIAILLGKSTSRLCGAVLLLLVQFPFTLLAMALGGVGMTQILATYCTLLAYIFFLCNFALFWSVITPRTTAAGGCVLVALVLLFVVPPILQASFQISAWNTSLSPIGVFIKALIEPLNAFSPFYRLTGVMATGFGENIFFVPQVLASLAFGIVFFLLAWMCFDTTCREQKEAAPARGLLAKRTSRLRRFGAGRASHRAIVWKDFHFTAGGSPVIIGKLIFYALLIGGIVWLMKFEDSSVNLSDIGNVVMWVAIIGLGLEALVLADRVFHEEIKWKTLSSVMMLPLSPAQIAYRKIAGCALALLPACAVFVVGAILSPDDFWSVVKEIFNDNDGLLWTFFWVGEITFFLHLTLYLSLIMKRAAGLVAFAACFLGNYLLLACFFMLARLFMFSRMDDVIFSLFSIVLFGLSVVLHFCIPRRLERAAAE